MKRVILYIGVILGLVIQLGGCSTKEVNKQPITEKETERVYESLSDISMFSLNNTWKYTSNHVGCELFEWGEYAVLPVPMIEGSTGVDIVENGLYAFGISKEEWDSYVEQIKKEWDVTLEEVTEEYFGTTSYMNIYNAEYNYNIFIMWSEEIPRINAKNCVSVSSYVGCQKKSADITNDEVLKKVKEQLNKEEAEYKILNVSSKTNIEDGFGVYHIITGEEFGYGSNHSYLCVVRGGKIVALEPNVNLIGQNEAVEFLQVDGVWKMYAIAHGMYRWHFSGDNPDIFMEFVMENDIFVLKSEEAVYNFKDFKGMYDVTFKKNGNKLDVYKVIENRDYYNDGSIPFYEVYSLGEKVGTIDGSEMETVTWE